MFFGNKPDERWILCKQMGIQYAIAKLAPELTDCPAPWDFDSLRQSKEIFAQHGFELVGLEGDQFNMDRIKLGLPGRDDDIALYQQLLRNMGRLNIKLLCYNFMAGIGWYRTHTDIAERGNALVSGFDYAYTKELPFTKFGEVSEQTIWENYRYFISKVLPVAEESGVKMALHPDDPPVSPLFGIGRIFINASGIRKAVALSNSISHGLTFCQGTYATMGENLEELITEFKDRIHFIHIRDVKGTPQKFVETFHDNGQTNVVKLLQHYQQLGINVWLRSDHVPTLAGEENTQFGYTIKGSLFSIGYLKGILASIKNLL